MHGTPHTASYSTREFFHENSNDPFEEILNEVLNQINKVGGIGRA
jgi:hypothetical protein